MNWSTVAALISAGAAVAGVWFAWQKHKRETASVQPSQNIPATPTPTSSLFPTTYNASNTMLLESDVGADYSKLQCF